MQLAGLVVCPADSCPEVKLIADYVSNVKGGNGAVRDGKILSEICIAV